MDKVNERRELSYHEPLFEKSEKEAILSHEDYLFARRIIEEYREDHAPTSPLKIKDNKGAQGRAVASLVCDIGFITQKLERFNSTIGQDPKAIGSGNTSFQSAVSLFTAPMSIMLGGASASDEIEDVKKSKTHTAKGIHAIHASRNILGVVSAAQSGIQAGFSLAAVTSAAAPIINGLAALKAAGGPLGAIFFSALVIPRCIEANKAIVIQNIVKDKGIEGLYQLFKTDKGALELILPDIYKKLKEGEKITSEELVEIEKTLKTKVTKSLIGSIIGSVSLLLTVLGTVLTSGVAPLAILIAGLVVNLITGSLDVKDLIDMLKKAVTLTNKDVVIKVITIVLALTAAVVSIVVAPTVALQLLGGLVCSVMALVPLISLTAMAIKVQKLADERKKEQEQKDYEKFILRTLKKIAIRELGQGQDEVIRRRVNREFLNLFPAKVV